MLSLLIPLKLARNGNSGGRRIRAIYLKVSSFVFCDDQMLEQFKKYTLIRDYILEKEKEIKNLIRR
jgi:miniconductance mechanosensitive channel